MLSNQWLAESWLQGWLQRVWEYGLKVFSQSPVWVHIGAYRSSVTLHRAPSCPPMHSHAHMHSHAFPCADSAQCAWPPEPPVPMGGRCGPWTDNLGQQCWVQWCWGGRAGVPLAEQLAIPECDPAGVDTGNYSWTATSCGGWDRTVMRIACEAASGLCCGTVGVGMCGAGGGEAEGMWDCGWAQCAKYGKDLP